MKEYYQVLPAEKGHWRITSSEEVCMDLFEGRDRALLWDTGYGFGPLKETIRNITEKPLTVVNSHGHMDHTCGNFQFLGADFYLAPEDKAVYLAHNSRNTREKALDSAGYLPASLHRTAYLEAAVPETKPALDGQNFDLGGRELRLYSLPGHTRGSLGLLDLQENILFTGDSMNAHTWLFLPESGDRALYMSSIRRAKALKCSAVYCSHDVKKLPPTVLDDYFLCAETAEFEKGIPASAVVLPFADGQEVRIIFRSGYIAGQENRPGFACLFVTRDRL